MQEGSQKNPAAANLVFIPGYLLLGGGVRHQQTLRALIDAGANLQLTDRQGNTPLQLAKSRGYTEMVQMLERRGKAG